MPFINSSRHRPQILLVEDDEMLLEVMTEALKRERYTFVTARSGDEAIQLAYTLGPEVVLLDIDLPGQSGLLVAAKLKVVEPSPKVLFVTALPRGQSDRLVRGGTGLCGDVSGHARGLRTALPAPGGRATLLRYPSRS